MKPDLNPQLRLKESKHFLLRTELERILSARRLLSAEEAKKIQLTLIGERLQIDGPRELLDKIARFLAKDGAKRSKNPYGP